ncbi:unnamed protein product [Vicia faba]|uniref:Uncharacterized protein n=1 Tax=Vicia faba TaxID=3906 RepID=A0AAV1ATY1_VICFA|nr:unnamed protein product [Vicia faba]
MPAYVDYVDLSVAAGPLRSIGFLVFDPRPCDELKLPWIVAFVLLPWDDLLVSLTCFFLSLPCVLPNDEKDCGISRFQLDVLQGKGFEVMIACYVRF